ncbi:MAG: M48 family metalloprotease, partial [Saprospiraceae bacterium]
MTPTVNPVLTAQDESAIGDKLYQGVMENPTLFPCLSRTDYPSLYQYLDAALSMVEVQTTIRDDYDWEVLILQDDENENIYSVPGGKIFITTGMMKFIEGEHQLFALLAHEAYYIDRRNQNGSVQLSYVMQRLKDEIASTQGTGVFRNFVNGTNDDLGIEIQDLFQGDFKYDENVVYAADDYALNMICENYLYSARGLKEILLLEENNPTPATNFVWLNNRPPNYLVNPVTGTSVMDRI